MKLSACSSSRFSDVKNFASIRSDRSVAAFNYKADSIKREVGAKIPRLTRLYRGSGETERFEWIRTDDSAIGALGRAFIRFLGWIFFGFKRKSMDRGSGCRSDWN